MAFSIKSILPRTLFGRSMLIMVTPVILLQIISVYIFYDRHWSKITERLAYALAGEVAIIAGRIEENPDHDYIRQMSATAAQYLGLLVSYEPGKTLSTEELSHNSNSIVTRKLSAALQEQVRRPFRMVVDVDEKWIEMRIVLKDGVLNIMSPQRRMFTSTGQIFLLWMISSSIILMAIAVIFMRNQLRPIRRLAVAAERIGKGRDLPPNFKPEGAREVRQASQAFIDMHERIKRQLAQRTAMLAGVSHDLRTPLTRLKLQVAMLGESPDADAMKHDIDDMERMLKAYLDFVRGEGGETAVRTDLKEVIERLSANVRRSNGVITASYSGDLVMSLRPMAFERCLNNLIGNARKYAKNVWVGALREDGEHILIVVDDDGPGIPEDQYDEVFKPFVRVEKSRNQATGGVGLGLSIAQDIVHSHGGQIWLEKSPKGGLRVSIRLPV